VEVIEGCAGPVRQHNYIGVRTCPVVRDLAAFGSTSFCSPQVQLGGANSLDETTFAGHGYICFVGRRHLVVQLQPRQRVDRWGLHVNEVDH
jgi:hypothetical protein